MNIISILRFFRDLIKFRGFLYKRFYQLIDQRDYESDFRKKFNYFPDSLAYDNIDMIDLRPNARIGDSNKILYYPFPQNNSILKTKVFLGENAWTGSGVELNTYTGGKILIKANSSVQDGCKLIGDVVIERYCLLAPNVFISSGNHNAIKNEFTLIRNQDRAQTKETFNVLEYSKPVHIEEDCWLGVGVFIRQGIYIGRGVVVGANACITKDIEPYSVVVGNNRVINTRIKFTPPNSIDASEKSHLPYFYRGFMQKYDEIFDHSCFALYEEEAIVVLQKTNFKELMVKGILVGEFKDLNMHIIINGIKKFSFEISSADFCLSCNPYQGEKYEDDDLLSLANSFNLIKIKIEGYRFHKEKYISLSKIIQVC